METISVIVPCFNEEDALHLFLPVMEPVMQKLPIRWELIFVDDGSTDGTLSFLTALHQRDSRYRYLSFSRNFGKEAALYAGLQAATGDYAAVMDADLQDPPEMLLDMYRLLQDKSIDCAAARRTDRTGEPWLRSRLSDGFYRIVNHFSVAPIPSGVRDFRLMRRNMVDAILSLSEYNRFSKGMFSWVGFHTQYLPYQNVQRSAGTTKWSFRQLVSYAVEGLIGYSVAPLSLPILFGCIFCGLSLLVALFFGIRALIFYISAEVWAWIACMILFVGGIQLLCCGILGQYLSRTYLESKHRPIYIIREASDEAH